MLSAQDSQFTLHENGRISYQVQASNPLPGVEIATAKKGAQPLAPAVELLDVEALKDQDKDALLAHLQGWIQRHIATVLEPLVKLAEEDAQAKPAVQGIAAQVHEAMGIIPREQVQDLIDQLDTDDRAALRAKRIRLGPILVFQPDLNKPAAVRLRALLWSLWNDKALPASVPNDGIVSQKIEGEIDENFYRAISYPVYGGRAIRIDMLDRVVSAVYDAAEGGHFKAQHQMAEWLGCPILDLYAVLEAMGHTKTHDPADSPSCHSEQSEESPGHEAAGEISPSEDVRNDSEEEAKPQEKLQEKLQEKPELATFRLKKGRANQKASSGGFKKKPAKSDKPKKQHKGKRNKSTNKSPRIMSAEAKNVDPDDNPFAILKQLKK